MPADFNIIGNVSLDPQSISATEKRLQALSRNQTINLKVNALPLGRINGDLHEFDKSLQASTSRVLAFGATTSVLYGVGRAFTDITRTFIDVEAKLKSIQVILQPTTAQFKNFAGELFNIARDTGKGFDEVADAATELSRQGLKIQDVLQRTSDSLKLSRQSGLGAAEAVTALTSAMNTFNQEALNSTVILNKLANVDQNFAVSQKDLVQAIGRAGAAAQDAGVNFDKLLSFTASLQQTTARGGAVIGNALKSIFTRVERSSTLDALEQFNIKTRDLQGNVLSADKVLQNLAGTYKTLSRSEQVAVSERVAGIQQINQLKALLGDLARANSIYSQSLAAASSNTNSAIERNKLLNQTLSTQLNATKQNAIEFSSVVGKLVFAPAVKNTSGVLDAIFSPFKQQSDESQSTGQKIGTGILKGIGQALAGPGLILGASVIVNLLKNLTGQIGTVLIDYASLSSKTKEQSNLQGAINQILASGNQQYVRRLAAAKSIKDEEEAIKNIMVEINALQVQRSAQFYSSTSNLVNAKNTVNRSNGGFNIPRAANGYLPVNQERADISNGVGGASPGAQPKIIPNFNFGGGKKGSIVANTDEYEVPNFRGGEGSAIFNQKMARQYGLPPGARKINAASGFVPNYFDNKYSKDEIGYNGALIDKNYKYIFNDEQVSLDQRLAARKKGFEILSISDAEHIQKNSNILKGHKLSVADPKSRFTDLFGETNSFKVSESKSFSGDKLAEAQLSKSLAKSIGLSGLNPAEILSNARKSLGDAFFIKARSGAQGEGVSRVEIKNGEAILHEGKDILKDLAVNPQNYFAQKAFTNVSGNEFRVNVGGSNGQANLLSGALLRSKKGKLATEFLGDQVNIGSIFSKRGISNRLSRFIAERQGIRAFKDLPENIRNGGIAGLDVLETGNRGISKAGQALAELVGLGRYVKGGGVAEFNFSQSERAGNSIGGGQPGYSGSLDITSVLLKASRNLLKNNGGFAKGYVPSYNDLSHGLLKSGASLDSKSKLLADLLGQTHSPLLEAINREKSAGIAASQIKIEKSSELVNSLNPQGLAITNTRDEPGGIIQGINRARKEGKNPKNYGNAGQGYYPNFADLNITPAQLGQLGSPNAQNFLSKQNKNAINDFAKSLKLDKADLAGSIQQIKSTVSNAVIEALKIDPRFITKSQQAGAEKIGNLFVRNNQGSIRSARIDTLDSHRQNAQVDKLISEFSKGVVTQNTLFRGGSKINNLSNQLYSSTGFRLSLNEENQNSVRKEITNIVSSQRDTRRSRLQGAGLLASFAAPILTNTLTSLRSAEDPTGRKINAAGNAIGTGVSTAAIFGFTPIGLAIGGVTAGLIGLKEGLSAGRKSLDDYSKQIEDTKGRFEQNKNAVSGGFQAQEQLKDIIERGGSRSEISQVSQQIQESIKNIADPSLRNQFINAKSDDQKRDLLIDISAKEVKETSSKALQGALESIIDKNRTLGVNNNNIFLKNEQRNDISGLVTNSLPLNQNGVKRASQLQGLQNLNNQGNFNLNDVQGVLGKLKVDSETTNKFKQLAETEQEAIAKNVVERQLSAAAIEKETQNLKTFTSSLLNVSRTIDRLQSASSFNFQKGDISSQGVRGRAISGANQSLGILGEFLAPETRNRQENIIKGVDLENDRTNSLNKISIDFASSLKEFPDIVKNAFKAFQTDADPEKGNTFARSEKFQSESRQLILSSLGTGKNPADTVNDINKKFDQFVNELSSSKGNKEIIKAINDFKNNNLNVPIQLEQERANQRKALQENTNRLNELNISLSKKVGLFGGGNFESNSNLDLGKITSGLRLGQSVRNSVNNPFNNRIYETRGSDFTDSFQGRKINEEAENSRKGRITSTLASGRLQAYQLGLFENNPGAINETRGLVSQAEQSSLQNKIDQLTKAGRNSGDIGFVNQLATFTPDKLKETADLKALKQVPLDDKTREKLENQLGKINNLLTNGNLPNDLKSQLKSGRRDIENQIGPEGVFRELNSQLTDLNTNFKSGIKGNFDALIESSKKATEAMSDLESVTKLLAQGEKEQVLNTKILSLNSGKNNLEKQIENLKEKNTLDSTQINPLENLINSDKNAPNKSFFRDRLDKSDNFKELSKSIDPKIISEFSDFGHKYHDDPDYKASNLFSDVSKFPSPVREKLLTAQFKNLTPPLADSDEKQQFSTAAITNATDLNQKINAFSALSNPGQDSKLLKQIKELETQKKKIENQLDEIDVNKSGGFIPPTYSKGLMNSFAQEKRDIFRGVGGALPSDKPYLTTVKGIGPAVVNTGETVVKNFGGTGKDAILNRKMKKSLGVSNYAEGFLDKLDDKVGRFGQDGVVTVLKHLPEFFKKPIRYGVGRVLTNLIDPISVSGKYYGTSNESIIDKNLFNTSNVFNTIKSVIQDKPAYLKGLEAYSGGDREAERSLFREYFDLDPQDKTNAFIKNGKNYQINPKTTNDAALAALRIFKEGPNSLRNMAPIVSSFDPKSDSDKYDFDLHPEELEKYKGKQLPFDFFGRSALEAIGHPASVKTRGYAKGLIPNYAEGEIPDTINPNKIPGDCIRAGEEIVMNDDLDNIAKIFKKEGISGVKRYLQNSNNQDKRIANKADGEIPDTIRNEIFKKEGVSGVRKYLHIDKEENLSGNQNKNFYDPKSLKDIDMRYKKNQYGFGSAIYPKYPKKPYYNQNLDQEEDLSGNPNKTFYDPSSIRDIGFFEKDSLKNIPQSKNTKLGEVFGPTLKELTPPSKPFFSNGDSIFGNNQAKQRQRQFDNQFKGGNDYQDLNISDLTSRRTNPFGDFNKTGNVGGFQNTSLQTSGGLDRKNNYRTRTPEENETFFRQNPSQNRQNNNRFDTSVGVNRNDQTSSNITKLITTIEDYIKTQQTNGKSQTSGEAVTVEHKIQVQVNGSINVNNDAVKTIVDEEIEKANNNIKARVAALETASKTGKPLEAIPPKIPDAGGG